MPEACTTAASRKALYKNIRAKARQEGITFNTALLLYFVDETKSLTKYHGSDSEESPNARRKRRRDNIHVDSTDRAYDLVEEIFDVDEFAQDLIHTPRKDTPLTISLLDIIRPAKVKGKEKDFEIVRGVGQIIVLEDESDQNFTTRQDDTEEWEQIPQEWLCEDVPKRPGPSYSEVVRSNG